MLDNDERRSWGNPDNLEELFGRFNNVAGAGVFRETPNVDPSRGDGRQPDKPYQPDDDNSRFGVFPGSAELDLTIVSAEPQSFVDSVDAFYSNNNVNAEEAISVKGFEAIAWYHPFHNLPFYNRWGVYVRADMLLELASRYWGRVPASSDPAEFLDVVQTIWKSILTHEYFHFQTEVFALMTEQYNVASGIPVFFNYQEKVYKPNWGTADCLEEALATAKEIKSIPDSGVKKFMANLALHSPGGYRHYNTCMPPRFTEYQDLLYSQVAEGSLSARSRPHRSPRDRGLFSTANVPVYLVVPMKDGKTDDALVVFEKQQPQVKTHQLLKYAERIGGYVQESGGHHPVVLRADGRNNIAVPKSRRNEPVNQYLIDEIAEGLGKSKQEVREEASRM